jgi:hypothetical protein
MKHPELPQSWAVVAFGLLLAGCDPAAELPSSNLGDLRPPSLVSQTIDDDGHVRLVFDEAVSLDDGSLRFDTGPDGQGQLSTGPAATIDRATDEGEAHPASAELELAVRGHLDPGREYAVELRVQDPAGNSLTLVLPFWGPNPRPPALIINEVLSKSSTRNRDTVEILVTKGGNLGGASLFLGLPMDFDACYTFPAIEVKAGDYLLLHCKPEGIPGEIDETACPGDPAQLAAILARASGLNASPLARDFWWRDAPGLPDDCGIVTLANTPLGKVKDALFYSNKTTVAGKEYRSFGTKKMLDRAEELQRSGMWRSAGTAIMVEDAASSAGLTATRTLCRDPAGGDTDQARDWHIVPSGKTSLGAANLPDVYIPK